MRDSNRVTLIGAGLAGSLLATFLARRGYRVTVFEKRADIRKSDGGRGRSINLALANRGLVALDQIGAASRLRELMIPMAGRMLHDEQGRLQFLPYGNKPHEVIYSISRAGLNALLMDFAQATGRVDFHFESVCRDVDFRRREVIVGLPGGESESRHPYDVLIGTDGSASAVRTAILRATGGSIDQQPLGHGYKELTIPAADDGSFRMQKNSLHVWPRGDYMLIALPNIDGSFTVTLFLPKEGPESFDVIRDGDSLRQLFDRRFPDAAELIPDLEEEFFENPTGHLETIRAWPWHHSGDALILGDAAHAIVPFHGQGMNAAFEDCNALDQFLGWRGGSWDEVFAGFARARKPNADAIAEMALENYVEMRSTVRDPKFALKKALSFRLEERFPDRFVPRYSMVMFHSIPYADAQERGLVQEAILEELVEGVDAVDRVDLERARELIVERLEPFRNGDDSGIR
jgi:kynurenine 3-monooxygenase